VSVEDRSRLDAALAPPHHHRAEDLDRLLASGAVDVVVVGAGGAGATAAIATHDLGASVVVVEKSTHPGGNTEQSGGSIRTVTDAPAMAEHFFHLAQGTTPRTVMASFVEHLALVPEWIQAHGGELGRNGGSGAAAVSRMLFPATHPGPAYPDFPGADALTGRAYVLPRRPGREGGAALWDFLDDALAAAGVPVVLGAQVTGLVEHGRPGAITGVEVDMGGRTATIPSRRGVILACGGFAYDTEHLVQYLGVALPTVSAPGVATGDGVRLAQSVGADLWHMGAVSTSLGYRVPELEAGFYCEVRDYGFVVVDQVGRRYSDEGSFENHGAVHEMLARDGRTGRQLRAPSFLVFDEQTRLAGPLTRQPNGANASYPWSRDNSAEVERGWFTRAESIARLAEALGLPAAQLEASVVEYNARCLDGAADPLGRSPERRREIVGPPFYGAAVYPTILNTQGGPRRDEQGRILRPDGAPIPGLYGAGELGSVWGPLYPGTGNISECLASGLLAAESVCGSAPST